MISKEYVRVNGIHLGAGETPIGFFGVGVFCFLFLDSQFLMFCGAFLVFLLLIFYFYLLLVFVVSV